ncbi:hypothetical protein ABT330_14130 [Streptomyces sp. NPDC000658]|uniref:hypothetical protein n=1 Tax=Streptomyces sp. NPDC000658 TaxID=3154266 RepID=UPI00332A0322
MCERSVHPSCLHLASTHRQPCLRGRGAWVEPADPGHKKGSGVNNRKDPVETKLHTAVCAGKVTLAQAQQSIVTDWTTALTALGLS